MFRRIRGATGGPVALIGAGALAVAGAGIAVVLLTAPHGHASGAAAATSSAAVSSASASSASGSEARTVATVRVLSLSPAPGAHGVSGATPIRLTLAAPAAPSAPLPRVFPAIPGRWQRQGTTLTFTPATAFRPGTRVTVSVARPDGARPDGAWSASYTTGAYSFVRLQQLLAQLGYLPLSWTAGPGGTVMPGDAAAQLSAAYSPPAGAFSFSPGYPSSLEDFWDVGRGNLITTGAIMAFESQHGMVPDATGTVRPALWSAVLRAAGQQAANPAGYTYAIASKTDPETLTIWHDGRKVFRADANTGIPIAPTANGTFPVYLRYRFQIMRGTNPDGSHYADPVEFVAYFHAGQAVHYFPRYTYGWPQSLGCVELPLPAAAKAWPYLTYGSLVTVRSLRSVMTVLDDVTFQL